ncbi:sulfotransferase family 2 domain-containing protein [Mangrovicoccus sp. HB161399]|uniref:sulfotransferase family 2 domain-containing protein n=1 Tax=Mangrovicoccus sp. HB161399 TaxID=2720392 RepID=UPI001557EF3F|nr:sulfotransferase family 2 domain-containing protein [Mangrovicoccus sp. HB161399]
MADTAGQPPGAAAPLPGLAARLGANGRQLDYLVNPDPARGIAYVETPKVACTAVKDFMQSRAAGRPPSSGLARVHDRDASPLPRLSALPVPQRRAILFGPVRRFSFTRNPFTRVLSGYLDKLVASSWERSRHLPRLGLPPDAMPDFPAFLRALASRPESARDIHFADQSRLLMLGDVAYDFLGAFETFGGDFAEAKRRYYGGAEEAAEAGPGRHHATGAGGKLAGHYGPAEIALVRKLYARDFELLGYSTELEEAGLPPVRTEPPQRSVRLAARRLGLPDPAGAPAAFRAALDAAEAGGRLPPERAANLRRRAGEECPLGPGVSPAETPRSR